MQCASRRTYIQPRPGSKRFPPLQTNEGLSAGLWDDDAVESMVKDWIRYIDAGFFRTGFQRWVERWKKSVLQGYAPPATGTFGPPASGPPVSTGVRGAATVPGSASLQRLAAEASP